jgi:hypothetical protein
MRLVPTIGKLVALMLLAAGPARASSILDVSDVLDLTDPTQLGRLSRNAIAQDWTGGEPFPGVINTATPYHYTTYSVNVGIATFIQIEVDSISVNTFFSAYDTTYAPNSAGGPNFGFDTNWLGDAGSSGNFFGTDPIFFQVRVPQNHNLLIVVNNVAAGNVGVGDPFHLIVEGFVDSEFTDPSAVPEPATVFLGGSGLVFLLRRRIRRRY